MGSAFAKTERSEANEYETTVMCGSENSLMSIASKVWEFAKEIKSIRHTVLAPPS